MEKLNNLFAIAEYLNAGNELSADEWRELLYTIRENDSDERDEYSHHMQIRGSFTGSPYTGLGLCDVDAEDKELIGVDYYEKGVEVDFLVYDYNDEQYKVVEIDICHIKERCWDWSYYNYTAETKLSFIEWARDVEDDEELAFEVDLLECIEHPAIEELSEESF